MNNELNTFDVTKYLDSKEVIAEYLSQVLKDADMNKLLSTIGDIARA